jgi:hypothetical protein
MSSPFVFPFTTGIVVAAGCRGWRTVACPSPAWSLDTGSAGYGAAAVARHAADWASLQTSSRRRRRNMPCWGAAADLPGHWVGPGWRSAARANACACPPTWLSQRVGPPEITRSTTTACLSDDCYFSYIFCPNRSETNGSFGTYTNFSTENHGTTGAAWPRPSRNFTARCCLALWNSYFFPNASYFELSVTILHFISSFSFIFLLLYRFWNVIYPSVASPLLQYIFVCCFEYWDWCLLVLVKYIYVLAVTISHNYYCFVGNIVCTYILVVDTSALAKSNMDRKEYYICISLIHLENTSSDKDKQYMQS